MSSIEIIIFWSIIGGLFVMFSWMLWQLMRSADVLHEEISKVEEMANDAETKGQLIQAWEKLKEVNEKTWHRNFYPRILKIKAIIETKFKYVD